MTMFYLLSKSLYFVLQPSVWIMVAVLWALIERRPRIKKRLLIVALALFFVFGNHFLFNQVMLAIEPTTIEVPRDMYETALVLGGYARKNTRGGDLEFFDASDRLTTGLSLYKEGKVKKLLISSGAHPLGHPEWSEARLSADWLERCGVIHEDIHIEDRSLNTFQNALYSKGIIDSLSLKGPFLLITSASHVMRAEACFQKQDIPVQPLAVDHLSHNEETSFTDYFMPGMRTVIEWEVPIKEWVGRLVYKVKGYT
jgi:uncharacterized SAM-binding protein YcdF (DUF218 family)